MAHQVPCGFGSQMIDKQALFLGKVSKSGWFMCHVCSSILVHIKLCILLYCSFF